MSDLLQILSPENVFYQFKAGSKEECISKMIELATANGQLPAASKSEIIEALLNREKSMSTGIGQGLAIPHCSVTSISKIQCFMAISKEGIEFDSIDEALVHIVILLIVPKSQFQEHIRTLAQIAKSLNQKDRRERLIQANNFEEISQSFQT